MSTGKSNIRLITGLVLVPSLLMTYGACHYVNHLAQVRAQEEFDSRVRSLSYRIVRRMGTYEQVLRGEKAFLRGSIHVSWEEFRTFVDTLDLKRQYPGMQGLAISEWIVPTKLVKHVESMHHHFTDYTISPSGPRDTYSAITRIEPFTAINSRALGFDMYSEPVRRAAMMEARDTGNAALSGKITLIQESSGSQQPGFLMYMAVYDTKMPTVTVEQRRAALLGWAYAAFRMNDFMAGTDGERTSDLAVSVFDGNIADDSALLYRTATPNANHKPKFRTTQHLVIAGHSWTLGVSSMPIMEARQRDSTPDFVAATGITMSLMLTLLFGTLARSRGHALNYALQMTRELRRSEFRWKYALEGAGDGVWDWDVVTGEAVFSLRWKAMLGYEEGDITSSFDEWKRLIHFEDKAPVLELLDDYVQGRAALYASEMRLLCKDGSYKWVFARGSAVSHDAQGRPLRIIGTQSDITERKQAAQRETERQHALEATRDALQHSQKLESLGKLTGGVAHDFNNLLQVITSNLQLLLGSATTSAAEKRVQKALDAVDRGAKLSSQLLAFARRQPLQPSILNLGRLISDMDDMLRRTLGGHIEIETKISSDVGNTLVDPYQLENVVLNLAINARDAMPNGGKLALEVKNVILEYTLPEVPSEGFAGHFVLLSIADSGAGMSEEILARAIEPFFTTKPQGQGTGLGLSMAYGFVKQSGGHMYIDSMPGAGTCIRIYLPRSSMQEERQIAEAVDEQILGGNETVLVVEDNVDVLDSVVNMLTWLGYRTITAQDAQSAMTIIRGGVFIDVLFTDVVMPGPLHATEMAEQARQYLPNIVVIYTSGYTQESILQDGYLKKDVYLLSKPYRRDQLAEKIRQALSSRYSINKETVLPALRLPAEEPRAIGPELQMPSTSSARVHILLVEDNDDLRNLAIDLLKVLGYQTDMAVSAEQALDMIKVCSYDLLITDIGLPGLDGRQLVEQLTKSSDKLPKVIFATGYGDTILFPQDHSVVVLRKPYSLVQLQQAIEQAMK